MKLYSLLIITKVLMLLTFNSAISCSDSVGTGKSDDDENNNSTDDVMYHELALTVYDKIMQYYYVDKHNLFRGILRSYPAIRKYPYCGYILVWPVE